MYDSLSQKKRQPTDRADDVFQGGEVGGAVGAGIHALVADVLKKDLAHLWSDETRCTVKELRRTGLTRTCLLTTVTTTTTKNADVIQTERR